MFPSVVNALPVCVYVLRRVRACVCTCSNVSGVCAAVPLVSCMTCRTCPLSPPVVRVCRDSSLRERQELCFHMNEMLLESRRTHFGYGALGHSKGVVGARVADALPPSGSVVQGLLGDDGSDSGSSYSGSTVSSRTSLSSAHRQILAAITPGDAPRRSSTHRSINA